MERRDFLRMAAAAAALVAAPRTSRAATARVDVLVNEPIGTIAPDIYGHFVEHLGGVVYDGIWVGEGSKIANTQGIRQARDRRHEEAAEGRRSAGRAAASPTATTGATAPARATSGRAAPTSGPAAPAATPSATRSTTRTTSDRSTSRGSAGWSAASPTSPPTCAACRPATSTSGSSTATRPPARRRWPTCARATARRIRSRSATGASATRAGAAAATSRAEEYAVEFRRFTSWVPGFDTRLSFIASGPSSGDLELDARLLQQADREGPGHDRPRPRLRPPPLHARTSSFGDPAKSGWNARKGPALGVRPPSGTRSSRKPIAWTT